MKKYILTVFVSTLLIFTFTSCSDDDGGGASDNGISGGTSNNTETARYDVYLDESGMTVFSSLISGPFEGSAAERARASNEENDRSVGLIEISNGQVGTFDPADFPNGVRIDTLSFGQTNSSSDDDISLEIFKTISSPVPSTAGGPGSGETTPQGTVLGEGGTWKGNGLGVRITNFTLVSGCSSGLFNFDITFLNELDPAPLLNFSGSAVTIADSTGVVYSDARTRSGSNRSGCFSTKLSSLEVGSIDTGTPREYTFQVREQGKPIPDEATHIIISISRFGSRIQNAQWQLPIPR